MIEGNNRQYLATAAHNVQLKGDGNLKLPKEFWVYIPNPKTYMSAPNTLKQRELFDSQFHHPIKIDDNYSIFIYSNYNGTWMDGADLALIKLPDNMEDEKEFCVMLYFRDADLKNFPCDIDDSTVKGMAGFPVSEATLYEDLRQRPLEFRPMKKEHGTIMKTAGLRTSPGQSVVVVWNAHSLPLGIHVANTGNRAFATLITPEVLDWWKQIDDRFSNEETAE